MLASDVTKPHFISSGPKSDSLTALAVSSFTLATCGTRIEGVMAHIHVQWNKYVYVIRHTLSWYRYVIVYILKLTTS